MTWPEVLRWIALIAGAAASALGFFGLLIRMFRPIAETAANKAANDLRQQLQANDFAHVESRIVELGWRCRLWRCVWVER